jgi:hypothetical protein
MTKEVKKMTREVVDLNGLATRKASIPEFGNKVRVRDVYNKHGEEMMNNLDDSLSDLKLVVT